MEKIAYIIVKIVYDENSNFEQIIEEVDYYFNHKNIIETEIINYEYKE